MSKGEFDCETRQGIIGTLCCGFIVYVIMYGWAFYSWDKLE